MQRIIVTGGTGVLGRQLMQGLRAQEADAAALSHAGREGTVAGDLLSGQGLTGALRGGHTVIHAATTPLRPLDDLQMTRNLIAACQAVGIRHLVYVSIAGIDGLDYDYYRVKAATERLVERSGLPYSIQRATQFHEFIAFILGRLRLGPVQIVPWGGRLRPVEVGAVAQELARTALGAPAGRLPDLAGPQEASLAELAREAGFSPVRLPMPHPGLVAMGRALPTAPRVVGADWTEWLARQRGQPNPYARRA